MKKYEDAQSINVGTGQDCTIRDLAAIMKQTVGYSGEITFDTSKPDGTPRKVLDIGRIRALGWSPKQSLEEGLKSTYRWARDQRAFD